MIPQKVKDSDNETLATPLSFTGSVDVLDTELPATLVGFVSSHLQLENTLAKAQAEMDAAAKAAQAEARSKSKVTSKPGKSAEKASQEKLEIADLAPAMASRRLSLFDGVDNRDDTTDDDVEEAFIMDQPASEAA